METTSSVDYIIVGQGIAGTCMSYQLLKNGYNLKVIDHGIEHSASSVAAGLYNPIVFKRFTQSWMARELIDYLNTFYEELELLLNDNFHSKLDIVKIFTNTNEIDLWNKKSINDNFLSKEIKTGYYNNILHENAGTASVKESGAVDVNKLITSFRKHLIKNELLIEEEFNYQEVKATEEFISYKSLKAKAIIFCEGAKAIDNPYFPKDAFKLTHGEIIEINAEDLPHNEVINKGVFILPIGGDFYKVGSTYEWDKVSGLPSEKGLNELNIKLKQLINVPYKITSHKAGIRPTVADRRPLIGKSKVFDKIYFFNGMGTKGVMLAPYFSNIFLKQLTSNSTLSDEINIERFFSK
jgi:glycine/D-amino acid oxidase-like deaminating enzyme